MKLRRKLLSAGLALGASALTLTTSTFAWYTANTSVESSTINGATSATADSSSLFIANAKEYASSAPGASASVFSAFATQVQPKLVGGDVASDHELAPVAFTAVSSGAPLTYNTMAVSGDDKDEVKYTAITSAKAVYEYVLRFQIPNNNVATPVYISALSITNSATASDSQQLALADNATLNVSATASDAVGIKEQGLYNVDLLHSLKMTVVAQGLSFDTSEKTFSASGNSVTTIYDLDGFANTAKDVNIDTKANAVGYYNAVLGTAIGYPAEHTYLDASVSGIDAVKCVASTAKSAVTGDATEATNVLNTLFTMPADLQYMEVRFTFWLDGWDEFCYDTCRKQNFSVNMSFDTKNKGLTAFTAATGKVSS